MKGWGLAAWLFHGQLFIGNIIINSVLVCVIKGVGLIIVNVCEVSLN
jgi:hypothetical protein